MASTFPVLLLLSAGLFTVTVGFGDDCDAYITSKQEFKSSINCNSRWIAQHCCGTCDHRFCCPLESLKLSAYDQLACTIQNSDVLAIVLGIIGIVVTCVVFIICCCCPCCCMYNMCRTRRPVAGAQITTVMNTQCIQQQQQQQQPAQYPAYQPVPTQPGYSAQPMQTGPYQGQPYAPGPPPSYNMAANPGYPSSHAPYDGSQATYPMMPPAQSGSAYPPLETSDQLAYNPAYMLPPKTGY